MGFTWCSVFICPPPLQDSGCAVGAAPNNHRRLPLTILSVVSGDNKFQVRRSAPKEFPFTKCYGGGLGVPPTSGDRPLSSPTQAFPCCLVVREICLPPPRQHRKGGIGGGRQPCPDGPPGAVGGDAGGAAAGGGAAERQDGAHPPPVPRRRGGVGPPQPGGGDTNAPSSWIWFESNGGMDGFLGGTWSRIGVGRK